MCLCVYQSIRKDTRKDEWQVKLSMSILIIKGSKLNVFSNYSVLDSTLFIWLPDRFIIFSTMGTGKHKIQVTAMIKFWSLYGSDLIHSTTAATVTDIKQGKVNKLLQVHFRKDISSRSGVFLLQSPFYVWDFFSAVK